MKKLLLCSLAFAALQPAALFGQTFTGTWQGTLKLPQRPNGELRTGELRVVLKITTTSGDKLAAVFYSIDQIPQGAQPASANTVVTNGSNLKMTFASMNGNFEGTLGSDGQTMAGTWSQGTPMPLTLTRATTESAWTIPDPPPPPKMMASDAKLEFEVATIKPSDPNGRGKGIGINRSGMVTTTNMTLADLIKFGYDLHPNQVVGAPAWFDSDKFDVTGKPATAGMPTVKQMQTMLQKLIVDRFSLKYHSEKKELPVYAISVAKGGAKIAKEENAPVPVPSFGGAPQRGFNLRNATMAEFATIMQATFMDLPVVDQTGFGDTRYSFVVKFTPDPAMLAVAGAPPIQAQAAAPDLDAPPDLAIAMEQQLGLRLQRTKAPVDVMVIDKVEKPSPN
jgi:uncharacterized protein (TIGR03435 family)